MGNICQKRS